MCKGTVFAAAEIASDAAAATEAESLIDSDIDALKKARGEVDVTEAGEFVLDCSFQRVAAGAWWVDRAIKVVQAWN